MPHSHTDRPDLELADQQESLALSHFVHTLRDYRWAIVIGLLAVTLGYVIVATSIYLLMPTRKITSMPFRLDFDGAERGRYPNGLKFSPAEITSTPVLQRVWEQNELKAFMNLQTFSRSVFVLESNRELEVLSAEYLTKLSDPKLTPVERDKFEKEYELKRNAISKADYAIGITESARAVKQLPTAVRKKVLADTLAEWARQAAVEKRALDYRIPVLTTNLLEGTSMDQTDPAIALIMLRNKVVQLIENIDTINKMPGADMVRTRERRVSLGEARAALEDMIRFRIDPLLMTVNARGLVSDRAAVLDVLRTQVSFDERRLAAAQMKHEALRNALSAYEQERSVFPASPQSTETPSATNASQGQRETVMPQLSEGFIDRVVALASASGDREYRQKLVNNLTDASLQIIPAQASLNYHKQLLEVFGRTGSGSNDGAATTAVRAEINQTFANVRQIVADVYEIYTTGSKQLNPISELYTTLGPATARVERAVSIKRLAVIGLLITLLSIPVLLAGSMLHNRLREEEQIEEAVYVAPPAAARTAK